MTRQPNELKKRSGAELRALAEQRMQSDPAADARRHEASFLKNMGQAKEDFDWLVSNEAWTKLGFDTFAGWWDARVFPVAAGLGMRPTREVARTVIEKVAEEQKALPKDQRRSQRQIAEMVGVGLGTVNRQLNPTAGVPNGTPGVDPLRSVPDAERAINEFLNTQTDPEPTVSDSDAAGSAAGSGASADRPEPAAPEDHPAPLPSGETGGVAASSVPPAPTGDAVGSEVPPQETELADGRQQWGPTGVSSPAAAVPVPSWLVAISSVIAAVHALDEEDPITAAAGAEDDLAGELGSVVSLLTKWYRLMQEAK